MRPYLRAPTGGPPGPGDFGAQRLREPRAPEALRGRRSTVSPTRQDVREGLPWPILPMTAPTRWLPRVRPARRTADADAAGVGSQGMGLLSERRPRRETRRRPRCRASRGTYAASEANAAVRVNLRDDPRRSSSSRRDGIRADLVRREPVANKCGSSAADAVDAAPSSEVTSRATRAAPNVRSLRPVAGALRFLFTGGSMVGSAVRGIRPRPNGGKDGGTRPCARRTAVGLLSHLHRPPDTRQVFPHAVGGPRPTTVNRHNPRR
jgi:hypothetical protein